MPQDAARSPRPHPEASSTNPGNEVATLAQSNMRTGADASWAATAKLIAIR